MERLTEATAAAVAAALQRGEDVSQSEMRRIAYDLYATHALDGEVMRPLNPRPLGEQKTLAALRTAEEGNRHRVGAEYGVRWQWQSGSDNHRDRIGHRAKSTSTARAREIEQQLNQSERQGLLHRISLTSSPLIPTEQYSGTLSEQWAEEIARANRSMLAAGARWITNIGRAAGAKIHMPQHVIQERHADHGVLYGSRVLPEDRRRRLGEEYGGMLVQPSSLHPLAMEPLAPGAAYGEVHRPRKGRVFIHKPPGYDEALSESFGATRARVAAEAVRRALNKHAATANLPRAALTELDRALQKFGYDKNNPALVSRKFR